MMMGIVEAMKNCCDDTLEKFAAVIPEPASAAITSSSPALTPDVTLTLNNTVSGCRFALRKAVTVTAFESIWPNASEADIANAKTRVRITTLDDLRSVLFQRSLVKFNPETRRIVEVKHALFDARLAVVQLEEKRVA